MQAFRWAQATCDEVDISELVTPFVETTIPVEAIQGPWSGLEPAMATMAEDMRKLPGPVFTTFFPNYAMQKPSWSYELSVLSV